MSHTLQTYTGKLIDIFNPQPDQICIEDIAHALANKCRFNGHTKYFYSIAQHSLLVCEQCDTTDPRIKLLALLHDAAEAYLPDFAAPIKNKAAFLDTGFWKNSDTATVNQVEYRLLTMILQAVAYENPDLSHIFYHDGVITQADRLVLYWEKRDLLAECEWEDHGTDLILPEGRIFPDSAEMSEQNFLTRFHELKTQTP